MIASVLVGLALASGSDPAAVQELEAGDEAWFAGSRGPGAAAWRRAARLADDSPTGRAVAVMAGVRLLRAGSNLSILWRGPRIGRALRDCPVGETWCRLARVDFDLLGPELAGADREAVPWGAARVGREMRARAASRLALAGDPAALVDLPDDELDGLGRAVRAGLVPDVGIALIGIGPVGGAGTGVGASAHLVHPDVGRRAVWLAADALVASRAAAGSAEVRTPGTIGLRARAAGGLVRWWDGTGWVPQRFVVVAAGPIVRLGRFTADLGPVGRWDDDDRAGVVHGHGLAAGLAVALGDDLPGMRATVGAEAALPPLADYDRVGVSASVAGYLAAGRGVVAGRVFTEAAVGDGPAARQPAVGGPWTFRGARLGAVRGDWVSAAALEIRHPVVAPLWAAVFAEAATVPGSGSHVGGGAGLRWVLPPQPWNTVRVDLGVSDLGWAVHVAWGEAF